MCNIKPGDILEMIKKNKTAANLTGSWQTNFWMRNGSSSGSKKKYFLATNVFLFLVNIRNKTNKNQKKQKLNGIGKDKMLKIYLEVGEAERRHSYLELEEEEEEI